MKNTNPQKQTYPSYFPVNATTIIDLYSISGTLTSMYPFTSVLNDFNLDVNDFIFSNDDKLLFNKLY